MNIELKGWYISGVLQCVDKDTLHHTAIYCNTLQHTATHSICTSPCESLLVTQCEMNVELTFQEYDFLMYTYIGLFYRSLLQVCFVGLFCRSIDRQCEGLLVTQCEMNIELTFQEYDLFMYTYIGLFYRSLLQVCFVGLFCGFVL